MKNSLKFSDVLSAVTVDCKDNGKEFVVTERIGAIEHLLQGTEYRLLAREPLALLFAKRVPQENEKVVLVSSHVDCVYNNCYCSDNGEYYKGTFDNSFGNAAVLWCMLNDSLPANVVVAFTGDEEKDSHGVYQALEALKKYGCELSCAIVQDVTNVGWESGALFTIENDCGIDLITAYNMVSLLEPYDGKFAFRHFAEPDESWDYARCGVPCFTLCVPVDGNLHGDEGVLLRKESAAEYCRVLAILVEFFS